MVRASLLLLVLLCVGCAASVADLRSGDYRGTVVDKYVSSSWSSSNIGGNFQMQKHVKYYIRISSQESGEYSVEVTEDAFNAVNKGTRLPLAGGRR